MLISYGYKTVYSFYNFSIWLFPYFSYKDLKNISNICLKIYEKI